MPHTPRLPLPALAALIGISIAPGPVRAQLCAGDCDGGNSVSISELIECTGTALASPGAGACEACDVDGNTQVSIDELVAAVGAALNGCPAAPVASAVAHFVLQPTGRVDWGDVPFPSDLHRDEEGRIRFGYLPTISGVDIPIHEAMRELLEERDGFCATCNIYFPIEGEIEAATVTASEDPSSEDAVILADVDPASPERGRLFPLRVEWNHDRSLLAVRPVRGIALHGARRYAAALTTSARATDGSPIGPSDTFVQVRSRRSSGDPIVERARDVLAPALDELERIGIGRSRIVALASFTTEDVTADVLAARAVAQEGPPLEVTIDRRRRGAEIDDLLGVPSEDRPGIDVPPAEGVPGTRSIAHGSIAEVVTGSFLAPRIVSGTGTDIGTALRDEAGRIVAGPRESVPFLLTLPATPAGTEVPLIVAHHGFNASRTTGFATANTAARVGFAVLAIDAFQHGERAASARDELNAMRGDLPGADGFAETTVLDLSGRVFGLLGAEPGLELFPGYSLGAFLQFGADVASAVRAVREGTLAAALQDSGIEDFDAFDAERIGFIGNSLGAVVGASVLTAEPDVRFAVQNVPPGSVVETLAESPEFRPLVDSLFLPILRVIGPFDEVGRHLLFDPVIDMSRWILEPVDPLALAPYLLLDPVRPGGAPEILFQVAMLDEVAAPLPTASMLEATGSTRVTRYDPAAHGMLEVLHQASRYEPPVTPPFVRRPAEIPVMNPIVEEHEEIEAFLSEHLAAPGS